MTSKCMDRSCSGKNFAAMQDTPRDEILLPGFQRNPISINDQRVAALHDQHVFVEFMGVRLGCCSFLTGSESHLTTFYTVKNIALNSWCRLIAFRNSICRLLHELGEMIHVLRLSRIQRQQQPLAALRIGFP
jgi:hypothetical protein